MEDHTEIDLRFGGRDHAICCHRVGDVLVDPGPQSCYDTLLAALGGWQPRAILVTHIHLDHSAGVGSLLRDWPETEVWVHRRGARHLADPSKLISSATRIYGDRMGELWGEILPVPERNLVVLDGFERRDGFQVAYTPGHASHHVSFLHEDSGLALTGDVAGVRIDGGPVIPPTPPPDIDIELWQSSIAAVRAWHPEALAIAHFGTFADVDRHLAELSAGLEHWSERARVTTAEEFAAEMLAVTGDDRPYTVAMPMTALHAGLERYWQKRG